MTRKNPTLPKKTANKNPGKRKPAVGLTAQQQLFVHHYAANGFANQSDAYIKAGYKARGQVAYTGASALLSNPKVAAAVQIEREKIAKKLDITKERVLNELAAMAFYDAGDLMLLDPQDPEQVQELTSPRDIRKLPERIRRCIVGWSYDRNGNFILKLANKTQNLELIGRHLAMFVDRKVVTLSELEKASDAELDAKIAQSAQQIAELEGVPVESVLAQLRAATAQASSPITATSGATTVVALRKGGSISTDCVAPERRALAWPLRKATRVSCAGCQVSGTAVLCGQPTRQNLLRRLRDGHALNRALPALVGRQDV